MGDPRPGPPFPSRGGCLNHAVFMGMGEPLLNLDSVLAAARRLPDLGITHRRTTISTSAGSPALRRFVDEVEEPIRLALSLHAPENALRSELMPVNDRYPLEDVLAECRRYVTLRGRRVFVEYVMLAGVNDTVGTGPRARPPPRLEGLQGQPDPVQPDRPLRRLLARGDLRLPRGARRARSSGDGSPDARTGHRSRLRPAGGVALGRGLTNAARPAGIGRRSHGRCARAFCTSRKSRNDPAHTRAFLLVSVESGWWPGVAPKAAEERGRGAAGLVTRRAGQQGLRAHLRWRSPQPYGRRPRRAPDPRRAQAGAPPAARSRPGQRRGAP